MSVIIPYHVNELFKHVNTPCGIYEACPESKGTKVLNMYNILNLQKRHCK